MANLAQDRNTPYTDAVTRGYVASAAIKAGSLVGVGAAPAAAAAAIVLGVAQNSAVIGEVVTVRRKGDFLLDTSAQLTAADIGKAAAVVDDHTIALGAGPLRVTAVGDAALTAWVEIV